MTDSPLDAKLTKKIIESLNHILELELAGVVREPRRQPAGIAPRRDGDVRGALIPPRGGRNAGQDLLRLPRRDSVLSPAATRAMTSTRIEFIAVLARAASPARIASNTRRCAGMLAV